MPATETDRLIDRMPRARGKLTPDAPISRATWFRVGGPAEVLFEPTDTDDLACFLRRLDRTVPVTVIGAASNLIIRDGGIPGVTVKLGRTFSEIRVNEQDSKIMAGGGAIDVTISRTARDAGIAGMEFLSGIPGTIGGAVRMNAGAYDAELCDILFKAEAVTRGGEILTVHCDELKFAHRFNSAPDDWIFTLVKLRGAPDDPAAIRTRMEEIAAAREGSQPIRERTGGSTFKNPPGLKAWELIDAAGCRGLTRGGAQVSPQHCNFLINTGNALAADLEGLGEEVRERVFAETGIRLEWEIRRVGASLPVDTKHGGAV